MERHDKIRAAKAHVAGKIADIIEKNFDQGGSALETPDTFTALLEAFKAIEIAEKFDTAGEHAQDVEDYRQGVLKNSD